jgi:ribonuclease J
MLKITCHGAVNEIGGNKILLEDSGSALMLDFGKSFSGESMYFDEFLQPRTNSALRDLLSLGLLPKIEGIYRKDLLNHAGVWADLKGELPESARSFFECDLPGYEDYTAKHGPRVDGVLLSHAHVDHVQHICYLDPRIPIYCTETTRRILRAVQDTGKGGYESDVLRCREVQVSRFGNASTFPNELCLDKKNSVCERSIESIGDAAVDIAGFRVEAVPVDHSVPGACAYIIQCPSGKTVMYTGDVRFHGRYSLPPNDLTTKLRARTRGLSPDVVITEGTRIESQSRDNEADVEKAITEKIRGCNGLAIVDFGWKDISRFQTILNAAKATGRVLAVSPKVAYLWNLLREFYPEDYPDLRQAGNVRVYLERSQSMTYSRGDYTASKHTVGLDVEWGVKACNLAGLPESCDNPYLCHYYGGVRAYEIASDPRNYILHAGYFDMNELIDVNPPDGSIFIKAATEPFSAEMEFDEAKLANWLKHFHIPLDEGNKIEHHHVSGHASGPDLLDFLKDMNPARVIPIHTQKPEVFQAELGSTTEVIPPMLGRAISVS